MELLCPTCWFSGKLLYILFVFLLFGIQIDSFAAARDSEMHEATRRILSVLLRQVNVVGYCFIIHEMACYIPYLFRIVCWNFKVLFCEGFIEIDFQLVCFIWHYIICTRQDRFMISSLIFKSFVVLVDVLTDTIFWDKFWLF